MRAASAARRGIGRSQRVAIAIAAIAIATCLAPPSPASAAADKPEPQTNLADISDEVMCTVCGVPLELATEAPQANAERDFIRHLIAQGKTKDEIKDALVAQYGENVLAVPGDEGFDLAAWLVPGIAFVAAACAIVIGLRRWRRAGAPDDAPEPPQPGDDAAARRLDEDMGRYRL